MSIKDAAGDTRTLVRTYAWKLTKSGDAGAPHLEDLCTQIMEGEVTEAKAHRFLGYVQGCLVAAAAVKVEELRELNHRCEVDESRQTAA